MSIGSAAEAPDEEAPFTIFTFLGLGPFGRSPAGADDWQDGQLYNVSWQNTSQSIQKCLWQLVHVYRDDTEVPLAVFAGAFSSSGSDGSGGKGI